MRLLGRAHGRVLVDRSGAGGCHGSVAGGVAAVAEDLDHGRSLCAVYARAEHGEK